MAEAAGRGLAAVEASAAAGLHVQPLEERKDAVALHPRVGGEALRRDGLLQFDVENLDQQGPVIARGEFVGRGFGRAGGRGQGKRERAEEDRGFHARDG